MKMLEYRYDSRGNRFSYHSLLLDRQEYAKIISEINAEYEVYDGKEICFHRSLGINGLYYVYIFENRGFNDYNIVERFNI